MDTFDEKFRALCLALPGAEERTSHGVPCYFIRKGKQFAANVGEHHGVARAVWIAAPLEVQRVLVGQDPDRFFVPPYVGVRGWIGVYVQAEPLWDEIESLVREGHRLVAPARLLGQAGL